MEDLSNLVASLTGASMAATNTTSSNTSMTAPGSESESTLGVTPTREPGPDIPRERERTVLHPSGSPRGDSVWRRADGTAWHSSADEPSPGGESPGGASAGSWGQQ